MKEAMMNLSRRWVKVIDDGNATDEISWISKRSSVTSNQSISIRFTKDIAPFLSQLEGNFTKYRVKNISRMNSIYSIRIYEMLMRWKSLKTVTLTVDQLKDRLQLTSKGYAAFGNIRQKVLDPSILEILDCSDIIPNYEMFKKGNKVESIKFNFTFKPGMEPKNEIKKDALKALKGIKYILK